MNMFVCALSMELRYYDAKENGLGLEGHGKGWHFTGLGGTSSINEHVRVCFVHGIQILRCYHYNWKKKFSCAQLHARVLM